MADYSSGVVNYIVLVYRETTGTPRAHESDGQTYDTLASRSSEIKVMTETEYNALPASADSSDLKNNLETADLTTDAQDRILIIARVLGKGYTGSTPNVYVSGDLTNGNIDQQNYFTPQKTAYISGTLNITGVNLKNLSTDTPVGTDGVLSYTVASNEFTWEAPTETTPSAAVAVTMTNEIEEITLTANGGSTLTIEVVPDLLPSSDQTDTVIVENFYANNGPVFSAEDALHRSKKGSYLPTSIDPHGLGYGDLAQQIGVIPNTLLVGTSRLSSEAHSLVPRLSTPASTVGSVDRTLMWEMGGGSHHVRLYKRSNDNFEVTMNASWDGTQWVLDQSGQSASKMEQSEYGLVTYVYSAGTTPFTDADFKHMWSSTPTGLTALGSGFTSTDTDREVPRVQAIYSDTANKKTLVMEVRPPIGGTDFTFRIYADTTGLDIVANASWDNATALWSQIESAKESFRLRFQGTDTRVIFDYKAAAAGTWADTAWVGTTLGQIYVDPSSAIVSRVGATFQGNVTGTDYLYYSPKTFRRFFSATTGNPLFASGVPTMSTTIGEYGVMSKEAAIHGAVASVLAIPLDLPNGAVITDGYVVHSTNGTTWQAKLVRATQTGALTLSDLDSSGYTALPNASSLNNFARTQFANTDQNNTVATDTYLFYCQIDNGPAANADEIRVAGVEIYYTMSEVEL